MKKYVLLGIVVFCFSCATTKQNVAKKNKKGNLVGITYKKQLLEKPFSNWFIKEYEKFTVDDSIVNSIKKHLKDVTIKGFIGTWCKDSKREVPRFYKLLEEAKFNFENLELISLNTKKKAKGLEKNNNLYFVPTFIFYKKGKELGRFVEFSVESIEEDILKIISNQPYKHPYQE